MTNINVRKQLQTLEQELNNKYINRRDVIHGLLVTLLAKGNIVILGAAGTGKTDMVQTLARSIKSQCFETILTKTSSPEELFGAYDIRELEQGNYVRNTANTLVDSNVGFVDEVFKCNSATLNGLLGVMAQRTFRNGNSLPTPIPLLLFVGASNELPEGGADGALAALWDRFEMRYYVDYINSVGAFHKLLRMNTVEEPATQIKLTDLSKAQAEVLDVDTTTAERAIVLLWDTMNKAGYRMSDRKWRNSLRYMQANAYLAGRDELAEEDVSIVANMAWNETSQIKPLRSLVFKTVNPQLSKAQDIFDKVVEIYERLLTFSDNDKENQEKFGNTKSLELSMVHNKLAVGKKMINTIISEQKSQGKNTTSFTDYIEKINEMIQVTTAMLCGEK